MAHSIPPDPLTDSPPQAESAHSNSPLNSIGPAVSLLDSDLEMLRQLILGDSIEKALNSPLHLEAVSRVLPKAIAQAGIAERELSRAIMPTIEAAIRESVYIDEKVLAEHLFPVIGPAARKSISAAIGTLVQSLNQTLEYSISPKSIRWRFEAFRTGKTFAEVVMLRTLIFQVEQVLLIHKETGLLLQHRVDETAIAQDPDLVSAMLTAIEDFVQDSFTVESGETLDMLELGDLNVWIEQGPQSVLACVVRGRAPVELRGVLRRSQEKIQRLFGPAMKNFQGDAAAFEGAQPYLDDCLHFKFSGHLIDEKPAGATDRQKAIAWTVALLLVLLVGLRGFFHYQHGRRWRSYVADLSQQPGLTVISQNSGRQEISGLRDPLAIDPVDRLAIAQLDPEKVTMDWKPYWSLDPKLIRDRNQEILSVLRSRIESRRILFPVAKAVPTQQYRDLMDRQAEDIELLALQASVVNEAIEITVQAYGDRPGNDIPTMNLGARRANYVREVLMHQGQSATVVKARNLKIAKGEDAADLRGAAVFKVDFTR